MESKKSQTCDNYHMWITVHAGVVKTVVIGTLIGLLRETPWSCLV